jgi:hypothetical protein
MASRTNITTPVGRLVMGSLYKPRDKDFDGKPLTTKTGTNAGQLRVDYFLALAIPKAGETHWGQTAWGQLILTVGATSFPQAYQAPTFAWKIEDGDSTVPNKRGKKPCENEGWRGHWILKFSGGFAPKVYRLDGTAYTQVTEENYIKPGYFVQINGTVDGNGNQNNPGVYLNHSMVCFSAYGPEISFGPDVNDAGFGQSPLPAGASLTPPASTVPMPAAMSPAVGASIAVAIPVVPNPAFLQVPTAQPLPTSSVPAIAVPAAPLPTAIASPSKVMTAKAGGASYESFKSAGWDDANMIAQGFLQP